MNTMQGEILMTNEGYQELKRELEELRTVKRKEISEKIRVARGFGDLSENSEYDEAKNEQALVESKIATLEEQLKKALATNTLPPVCKPRERWYDAKSGKSNKCANYCQVRNKCNFGRREMSIGGNSIEI